MYEIDSFFDSDDHKNDFYSKLNNDKNMIVFLGSGANGKSTLADYLKSEHPDKFVIHSMETVFHLNSVIEKYKKTILIINDKDELKYIPKSASYDIVEFNKKFEIQ